MIWQEFDEIDSTSSEVDRQLATASEDIAIFAHRQTAGRGQRGRTWQSLAGNLHLSLGLKRKLPLKALPLIPAQISLAIAQFFAKYYAFGLTIKWPNDLLFAGAKIGGILCENKQVGDENWIIIGIGINVLHGPDDLTYRSTSLIKETNLQLSALQMARELATVLTGIEFQSDYAAFRRDYEYFAIKAGHRYVSGDQLFRLNGYSSEGAIILQSGDQVLEAFSAGTERYWKMQLPERPKFLMADIGNTRIKIKSDAEQRVIPSHEALSDADAATIKKFFSGKEDLDLFFSSVAPAAESRLLSIIPKGVTLLPVRKRWVRVKSQYHLDQIGTDRLLAMEGARSIAAMRDQPLMIFSFGTATTLDVIDQHGQHLGGHIIPGISTMASALHEKTALLPLVAEPLQEKSEFGLQTNQAIASGIKSLILGYIIHNSKTAKELTGAEPVLIGTGGHAQDVATILPKLQVFPDLIFAGIESLVTAGA